MLVFPLRMSNTKSELQGGREALDNGYTAILGHQPQLNYTSEQLRLVETVSVGCVGWAPDTLVKT